MSMIHYVRKYVNQHFGSTIKMTGFSDEQILELCYIAYPWAIKEIESGECTKEEQDEGFLENPVLYPFPWENWSSHNIQPKPSFKSLKAWVESRVHITSRM